MRRERFTCRNLACIYDSARRKPKAGKQARMRLATPRARVFTAAAAAAASGAVHARRGAFLGGLYGSGNAYKSLDNENYQENFFFLQSYVFVLLLTLCVIVMSSFETPILVAVLVTSICSSVAALVIGAVLTHAFNFEMFIDQHGKTFTATAAATTLLPMAANEGLRPPSKLQQHMALLAVPQVACL